GQLVQRRLNRRLPGGSHRLDLSGQFGFFPLEGAAELLQHPKSGVAAVPLLDLPDEVGGGRRAVRKLLPSQPPLLAKRPQRPTRAPDPVRVRFLAGGNLWGVVAQEFKDGAMIRVLQALSEPVLEPLLALVADGGNPKAGREVKVPNFIARAGRSRGLVVAMAGGVPPHPLDEVTVLDFQTCDQLEDRVEIRQPMAVLDPAESHSAHADSLGKLPLRQPGPAAEPDHVR